MKRLILVSTLLVGLAACGGSKPKTESTDGMTDATAMPTAVETAMPTAEPTAEPTAMPTASSAPSAMPTNTPPAGPAATVAAADATKGQKLYEDNKCNGCHGTKDKPGAKAPNLFKMKWDDDAGITKAMDLIKKGKSPMPSYKDKLDDKQIADVLAYFKANPAK
ncbi:MAG TPA: c-type cytochrome [Polyangiaceae bacterium]|jgi:mono/diheme cytochrome c family protein|nr:c-type cytochrome [Polyangiaceae bacterium]